VICERPYPSFSIGGLPAHWIQFQVPDGERFSLVRELLPAASVIANSGVILPPGGSYHVCNVVCEIPLSQLSDFRIEGTLGVLGAAPRTFTLEARRSKMNETVNNPLSPVQSSEILNLTPGD
jgi:hypothetical protein